MDGTRMAPQVSFILEGSNDLSNWLLVGSSGQWPSGTTWVLSHGNFNTPRTRNHVVTFVMVADWPSISTLLIWLTLFFTFLTIFVLAQCNMSRHCISALSIGYWSVCLIAIVTGVERAVSQRLVDAIYQFSQACVYGSIGFGMWYFERHFDTVVVVITMWIIANQVLLFCGNEASEALGEVENLLLIIITACVWLAGVVFLVLRRLLIKTSARSLYADKNLYQRVWDTLMADPAKDQDIQALNRMVRDVKRMTKDFEARQFNRNYTRVRRQAHDSNMNSRKSLDAQQASGSRMCLLGAEPSPHADIAGQAQSSARLANSSVHTIFGAADVLNSVGSEDGQGNSGALGDTCVCRICGCVLDRRDCSIVAAVDGNGGRGRDQQLLCNSCLQQRVVEARRSPMVQSERSSPLVQPERPIKMEPVCARAGSNDETPALLLESLRRRPSASPTRVRSSDNANPHSSIYSQRTGSGQTRASTPTGLHAIQQTAGVAMPSTRTSSHTNTNVYAPSFGTHRSASTHSNATLPYPAGVFPPLQRAASSHIVHTVIGMDCDHNSQESATAHAHQQYTLQGPSPSKRNSIGAVESVPAHHTPNHVTSPSTGAKGPCGAAPVELSKSRLPRNVGFSVNESDSDHTNSGSQHISLALDSYQVDTGSPVMSLDQLYAQACLLHPVMLAKVMQLAGKCRGMMKATPDVRDYANGADVAEGGLRVGSGMCRAPYGHVRIPSAGGDVHLRRSMSTNTNTNITQQASGSVNVLLRTRTASSAGKDTPVPSTTYYAPCDGSVPSEFLLPAKVKSASRCVDKADMAYGRDVSRLLDVCRQTLYFATVRDLHDCLRAITEDDSLQIVRIKSTLTHRTDRDPNFAGFRCSPPLRCIFLLAYQHALYACATCIHVCRCISAQV